MPTDTADVSEICDFLSSSVSSSSSVSAADKSSIYNKGKNSSNRIMSIKFVKQSGEKWIFTKIRQVQRGKVKNGLKRQFLHTWEAWVCISLSFLEMSERRIWASREICSNCSSSARVWNTEFYGIITLFQNTSFLKWLIICSKVKDCYWLKFWNSKRKINKRGKSCFRSE